MFPVFRALSLITGRLLGAQVTVLRRAAGDTHTQTVNELEAMTEPYLMD